MSQYVREKYEWKDDHNRTLQFLDSRFPIFSREVAIPYQVGIEHSKYQKQSNMRDCAPVLGSNEIGKDDNNGNRDRAKHDSQQKA